MSRLLVLFLGVFLLSGCTVHEYTGHGYHRPYYHGEYPASIATTAIQPAITDTTVPITHATLRHRWFGTSATSSIGVIVTTSLPGTTVRAVTVTTRTPCATRFNTGATGRLSPSSITIAAASGSGPALPPTVSRGLTRL